MDEGARTGGFVEAATQELEDMVEGKGVRWEPLGVDMEEEVGHYPREDAAGKVTYPKTVQN